MARKPAPPRRSGSPPARGSFRSRASLCPSTTSPLFLSDVRCRPFRLAFDQDEADAARAWAAGARGEQADEVHPRMPEVMKVFGPLRT